MFPDSYEQKKPCSFCDCLIQTLQLFESHFTQLIWYVVNLHELSAIPNGKSQKLFVLKFPFFCLNHF